MQRDNWWFKTLFLFSLQKLFYCNVEFEGIFLLLSLGFLLGVCVGDIMKLCWIWLGLTTLSRSAYWIDGHVRLVAKDEKGWPWLVAKDEKGCVQGLALACLIRNFELKNLNRAGQGTWEPQINIIISGLSGLQRCS